jgi:hypothetical protein
MEWVRNISEFIRVTFQIGFFSDPTKTTFPDRNNSYAAIYALQTGRRTKTTELGKSSSVLG